MEDKDKDELDKMLTDMFTKWYSLGKEKVEVAYQEHKARLGDEKPELKVAVAVGMFIQAAGSRLSKEIAGKVMEISMDTCEIHFVAEGQGLPKELVNLEGIIKEVMKSDNVKGLLN